MKHLIKVGSMLFIWRLVMYMSIPLGCSSKIFRSEPTSNKITPYMALQLFMKTVLTTLLKPTPEGCLRSIRTTYLFLARLLVLLYASIEPTSTLRFSTDQIDPTSVGLVGLLTAGSMVLMWIAEHIVIAILGGTSLAFLTRLLVYVVSGLLMLKTTIGKNPSDSFLTLSVLGLMGYLIILTNHTSQRLTAWHQNPDRKISSYCYVKLDPACISPLALAGFTSALQVSLVDSLFKWKCIQSSNKTIETSCEVLIRVGLMVYFCYTYIRWDVKGSYGSNYLKRSVSIIGFIRSGLKAKDYLEYIVRDICITKTLCISLDCGVIRLLYISINQAIVLDESSYIVLIAASLVLTEYLKFYANFIRYIMFFKACI